MSIDEQLNHLAGERPSTDSWVLGSALAAAVLDSVHHGYGALRYRVPSHYLLFFVGNLLYFFGASPSAVACSIPSTSEISRDAFFEITGLLQILPVSVLAWRLYRLATTSNVEHRGAPKRVAARTLKTIADGIVSVPAATHVIHLQFRRFAGCPVCNLHLRAFVRRKQELQRAGILEVLVFCSSRDELLVYAGDLPFAVVADPEKVLYAEFGVGSSPRAVLDPRAWGAIVRGVARSAIAALRGLERLPPIRPQQGSLGLPADFLVAPGGHVVASKYGQHADDQWSVDEVLVFAGTARP